VQSRWKIGKTQACIEAELDIISWLEKGERIVDICCNVRFAQRSVLTIRVNDKCITERAKSGSKVFV
jgi:hypothetical protein